MNKLLNQSFPSDSDSEIMDLFLCVRCSQTSRTCCERCGDYYCSVKCQIKDWRVHRNICFPLPALQPISQKKMKKSSKTIKIVTVAAAASESEIANDVATKENVDAVDGIRAKEEIRSSNCEQNGEENLISRKMQNVKLVEPVEIVRTAEGINRRSMLIRNLGRQQTNVPIVEVEKPKPRPKPFINMEIMLPKTHVLITHVIDYKTLVVRPTDSEYMKLMNDLVQWSLQDEQVLKIRKPIARGDIVFATSFLSGPFCRASVLNIDNDSKALVEFIDFGGREMVPLELIKYLDEDLQTRKTLLNKVSLRNVVDITPAAMEKSKDFLDEVKVSKIELILVYNKDECKDDQLVGELVFANSHQPLSDQIIEWNKVEIEREEKMKAIAAFQVTAAPPPSPVKQEKTAVIESVGFPEKERNNVSLLILDTSCLHLGYFTCIKNTDVKLYSDNDKIVNDYCATAPNEPYYPKKGNYCLAQYSEDERWYRAFCIQVKSEESVDVLFIDFGNIETVNMQNIRIMPKELTFPCITVNTYLEYITYPEGKKIASGIVDCLKKLLPSCDEFVFDSVKFKFDEEIAIARSDKLIKALSNENLL